MIYKNRLICIGWNRHVAIYSVARDCEGTVNNCKYRPVRAHIIEGLKYRFDKQGIIQQMSDLVKGDRVKIQRGPFTNFICKVYQIADSKRAWVLINLLQKQTRANISLDDLSKAN